MITTTDLVDAIFDREGDEYAEPPRVDQPTGRGGITLAVLRAYIASTHAQLAGTLQQLQNLTHDQAAVIVAWQLDQIARGAGLDQIPFEPLRLLMIDFAYNSGASRALRWLQRVLGVPVTGTMDAATIVALRYPFGKDRIPVWIHGALVAARLQMIDSAVDSHAIDKRFEDGLERRVLRFSLLEVK